jgi:biotin transport system substrate-specific component
MFGDIGRSQTIAYSAAFVGLITLGSWISIPFIPVPFTLQTRFILLAGAVMHRKAVIPVVLFLLLGVLGLPVFHNGAAGPALILGPTGGYLAGFVIAALVAGFSYECRSEWMRAAGMISATILILVFGAAWLMVSMGMALLPAVIAGILPFLAGDLLKAAAAFLIARRLL